MQVFSLLDGDSSLFPSAVFSLTLVKEAVGTACHCRLFVPVESILIPPGSLYTNRSKVASPETKMHAHRVAAVHMYILLVQETNGHNRIDFL